MTACPPWGPGPDCRCPDGDGAEHRPGCPDYTPPTVMRASLFDGTRDTYQTEAEINGYREEQGALFRLSPPPAPAPKEQGRLL